MLTLACLLFPVGLAVNFVRLVDCARRRGLLVPGSTPTRSVLWPAALLNNGLLALGALAVVVWAQDRAADLECLAVLGMLFGVSLWRTRETLASFQALATRKEGHPGGTPS